MWSARASAPASRPSSFPSCRRSCSRRFSASASPSPTSSSGCPLSRCSRSCSSTFQFLVGELLLSQERADELEMRAKQLAGFQVALLSALLRTLDLRDRMTARHSAAVARYSRELAARAGLSADDQELAHTAGLLHDIGKFVLPDADPEGARAPARDDDWDQIKRHPYEGARIVSQIDGYTPGGRHHPRPPRAARRPRLPRGLGRPDPRSAPGSSRSPTPTTR